MVSQLSKIIRAVLDLFMMACFFLSPFFGKLLRFLLDNEWVCYGHVPRDHTVWLLLIGPGMCIYPKAKAYVSARQKLMTCLAWLKKCEESQSDPSLRNLELGNRPAQGS